MHITTFPLPLQSFKAEQAPLLENSLQPKYPAALFGVVIILSNLTVSTNALELFSDIGSNEQEFAKKRLILQVELIQEIQECRNNQSCIDLANRVYSEGVNQLTLVWKEKNIKVLSAVMAPFLFSLTTTAAIVTVAWKLKKGKEPSKALRIITLLSGGGCLISGVVMASFGYGYTSIPNIILGFSAIELSIAPRVTFNNISNIASAVANCFRRLFTRCCQQ